MRRYQQSYNNLRRLSQTPLVAELSTEEEETGLVKLDEEENQIPQLEGFVTNKATDLMTVCL